MERTVPVVPAVSLPRLFLSKLHPVVVGLLSAVSTDTKLDDIMDCDVDVAAVTAPVVATVTEEVPPVAGPDKVAPELTVTL